MNLSTDDYLFLVITKLCSLKRTRVSDHLLKGQTSVIADTIRTIESIATSWTNRIITNPPTSNLYAIQETSENQSLHKTTKS